MNLDLVELDEVPGLEDDVDEGGRADKFPSAVDINPQVRQALSAIVEAIAEVSSMKADEEGPAAMELETQQQQAQALAAQQAQMQAQTHAQANQLGLTPQAFMQLQQHMHQQRVQQQIQQQLQQQQLHAHQLQQQQLQQQQQQRM